MAELEFMCSAQLRDLLKSGDRGVPAAQGRARSAFREFDRMLGTRVRERYCTDSVVDIVFPREPFILSRIVIAPPKEGNSQPYLLLQSFGGDFLSVADVVSLPAHDHDELYKKYVDGILGERTLYYPSGGYLAMKDTGIRFSGESPEFGRTAAGCDSAAICKQILSLTKRFHFQSIDVEGYAGQNTTVFFDLWLEMAHAGAPYGRVGDQNEVLQRYLESACRLYRRKIPAGRVGKINDLVVEAHIRAQNDQDSTQSFEERVVKWKRTLAPVYDLRR
jgi:hypothetical protein